MTLRLSVFQLSWVWLDVDESLPASGGPPPEPTKNIFQKKVFFVTGSGTAELNVMYRQAKTKTVVSLTFC